MCLFFFWYHGIQRDRRWKMVGSFFFYVYHFRDMMFIDPSQLCMALPYAQRNTKKVIEHFGPYKLTPWDSINRKLASKACSWLYETCGYSRPLFFGITRATAADQVPLNLAFFFFMQFRTKDSRCLSSISTCDLDRKETQLKTLDRRAKYAMQGLTTRI